MAKKTEEKIYMVTYSVTGRAHGTVLASSEDEAREKAKAYAFIDRKGATLTEWEYDDLISVEEER